MKYRIINILALFLLLSCSTQEEIDWSLIHDERMKEHNHYGITIRPNGDTIIHSAFSIKSHFFDRLDGRYIQYRNSKIAFEQNIENEMLERECRVYYTGGQLMKQINYHKGKRHGKSTIYYRNGTKSMEMYYMQNEKVGVWKYWDNYGQLIKTENYDH